MNNTSAVNRSRPIHPKGPEGKTSHCCSDTSLTEYIRLVFSFLGTNFEAVTRRLEKSVVVFVCTKSPCPRIYAALFKSMLEFLQEAIVGGPEIAQNVCQLLVKLPVLHLQQGRRTDVFQRIITGTILRPMW